MLFPKNRTRQDACSHYSIQHCTGYPNNFSKARKINKRCPDRKGRNKTLYSQMTWPSM